MTLTPTQLACFTDLVFVMHALLAMMLVPMMIRNVLKSIAILIRVAMHSVGSILVILMFYFFAGNAVMRWSDIRETCENKGCPTSFDYLSIPG